MKKTYNTFMDCFLPSVYVRLKYLRDNKEDEIEGLVEACDGESVTILHEAGGKLKWQSTVIYKQEIKQTTLI